MSKLLKADGTTLTRGIKEVKPCGSQVLVELLTAQEMMQTKLKLGKDVQMGMPQAVILDVGPAVTPSNWGWAVGDRVFLHGTGPIIPAYGNHERDRVLIEPHAIKAVIIED